MATSQDYSRSVIMTSDELKDIFCEPCTDDGKQVQAQGFCVDCSEYLCGQCYKHHRRYKAFKHHVLQDKDVMPLDLRKAGVPDVCRERCDQDPTKIVEYFCKSCDTLGCNACITVNHRQCKDVHHIPDIVQDLEASEEYVEFTESLDNKVQALDTKREKISTNKTETANMRKQAKEELKRQRDEINTFFDSLEIEMDRKITDIDNRNMANLKAASNRSDLINDSLQRIKTDIENKQENGQKCELFVAMKKSKSSMVQLDEEFTLLNEESKMQRYKLTQSRQIKDMLKDTTEICRMLTAEPVSEIYVRSSKDNEMPSIFGLAVVQQHYIAFTDFNNKSIKVIDTRNGKLTSEMLMDCKMSWDLTNIDGTRIAVSISCHSYQRKIEILSVSESGCLAKSYDFKTSYSCYRRVSSKWHLCILTVGGVNIIDTQGQILNTIKSEASFSDGIALSTDSKSIYVTNGKNNTVQKMTLDGKVEAVYIDKNLENPSSVIVDREGFVYVSSSGNACVHQLTENVSKVQRHIAYSSRDNILYVGGCNGIFQVYQLY